MSETAIQKLRHEIATCRRCKKMAGRPVTALVEGAQILSLGQAPGIHEERIGRPFAWTAGKTLFNWLATIGIEEERYRSKVNMSAVCRCFPGKPEHAKSGDRKPDRQEIENCRPFFEAELELLRPQLVVPIGKLAIEQILPSTIDQVESSRLIDVVGKSRRACYRTAAGLEIEFEWIALPHPSGLNTWNHTDAGKERIGRSLELLRYHQAIAPLI